MLVHALSLTLACPPTSIPTGKPDAQRYQQGAYLVSGRHLAALGIDAASTAELLLRQARIYHAFAEALNSTSDDAWRNDQRRRRDGLPFTSLPYSRGPNPHPKHNPLSDQATLWFERCYLFTTSAAAQLQFADACASALAASAPARYPRTAELVPTPGATTSMRSYAVSSAGTAQTSSATGSPNSRSNARNSESSAETLNSSPNATRDSY